LKPVAFLDGRVNLFAGARRMDLAVKPAKRAAVAKTKGKLMGAEGTPLFGDAA
jgi:hypothetical protein